MMRIFLLAVIVSISLLVRALVAADPAPSDATAPGAVDKEAVYKKFQETLSGARLTGNYTVAGKDSQGLKEESYTISSVTRLPEGDFWLFKTRIKYGGKDVVIPMPLEVKWAGDTPIITLNDTTIPGLGTFSARVVIDNQKYAGTWTHGQAGGHLFGKIEKLTDAEKEQLP